MTQDPARAGNVRVAAPARLHLGFLDLSGALTRRFGGIGLAVDAPRTVLRLAPAQAWSASGPDAARALALARRYAAAAGLEGAFSILIEEAIPAHSGLGSGTQLALGVGAALARASGRKATPTEIAETLGRGARSGIGVAAFQSGGLVVDGGRGESGALPPIVARHDVPQDWRIILIMDRAAHGLHGAAEHGAFSRLLPFADRTAGHLCRLTLLKLLPGLVERDIAAFGDAITEIQTIVGDHFAPLQGGRWTSKGVGRIAARLGELGAVGLGQTSWGPTGFAFAKSEAAARDLLVRLGLETAASGVEVAIVAGRNRGAEIDGSSETLPSAARRSA